MLVPQLNHAQRTIDIVIERTVPLLHFHIDGVPRLNIASAGIRTGEHARITAEVDFQLLVVSVQPPSSACYPGTTRGVIFMARTRRRDRCNHRIVLRKTALLGIQGFTQATFAWASASAAVV
ncbi:MAG: hypothetical protein ACLUE1_02385 [Adlercreutzia equolifaciens]